VKHILGTKTMSATDAIRLLDTAEEFSAVAQRHVPKLPTLRGVTMVNMFFEDSTRTRLSFEAAAKRLSADVMTFGAYGSSVSKGESLQDTAQTLEAMGADIIVIRHPESGAAEMLAESGWVQSSIINAGDGTNEHPTQALLDAATLRQCFRTEPLAQDLSGLSVLIVGDLAHSRVARSNVFLLSSLGATVTLVAPEALMPDDVGLWSAQTVYDFDQALDTQPDAVMMLRMQRERIPEDMRESVEGFVKDFSLSVERSNRLPADSIVMHPGPMNRGVEIAPEVADSPRSKVLHQVRNGVALRMAALFEVQGGQP
jgi:aspartate carbamoyltransferase catalytic subunit